MTQGSTDTPGTAHQVQASAAAARRGWRYAAVAAAGCSVACAGVVATLAVAGANPALAARLGLVLSGVLSVFSGGSVLAFVGVRRLAGRPAEQSRVLLGLALAVWGCGQAVVGLTTTAQGVRVFGVGDAVSVLAVPMLGMAFVRMSRRSRTSGPPQRLVLDGLTVTFATVLLLWWVLGQPSLPDPAHPGTGAAVGLVMMFFDVACVAGAAMVWARDRRLGAAMVTAALLLQAVADLATEPAVLGGTPQAWQSGALWCLATPLFAAGMIRYAQSPSTQQESWLEDLGESRATTISALLSMGVLALAMTLPVSHRWTPIGSVLFAASVALLMGRELLNSLVRQRLLGWLQSEALHDVLTGLPNRSALTARIDALDLSEPWVLLTIDLDDFKEINDLLGPQTSDELIVRVARALERVVPARSLVARMGGDEFGVLAPGTVDDGEHLAEQLQAGIRQAVRDFGGGVVVTAGIGVGRVLPETPVAAGGPGRQGPGAAAFPSRDGRPAAGGTGAGRTGAGGAGAGGAADGGAADGGAGDGGAGDGGDVAERHDRLSALLESAAALRAAKAAGRDRIARYPGAVEQARRRRMLLERRLRSALRTGTLDMHAQPIVELGSRRTVGFESLARWTDAVLGPVSPVEFIPVAEQTGLVAALGEFALRATILQARAGGLVGRDVELGVNVSPIQLRYASFAPMVMEVLEEVGLAPDHLLLEVTEAILVDEDDPASGALNVLADAGVRLAIDDFGTGYSALGYLRRLPMDVLKVDRSWVVASVVDNRTRDIVGGVVALAHTLGTTVVMEGIEDDETATVCQDLGADRGQGWLFGRPQPWSVAAAELTAAEPVDGPAGRPAGGSTDGPPVARPDGPRQATASLRWE